MHANINLGLEKHFEKYMSQFLMINKIMLTYINTGPPFSDSPLDISRLDIRKSQQLAHHNKSKNN